MPVVPTQTQGLQSLTVVCHQCGGADLFRLDRKEYKCNHCGAVTVISDNDAERLEQLLRQMLAKQAQPAYRPPASSPKRGGKAVALSIAGVIFCAGVGGFISLLPKNSANGASTADDYFAQTTVPTDRVTISPLTWVPDGVGGTYNGLMYNHSGYPIDPPSYSLALFHDGMKDDSSGSIPTVGTLEPGEYTPVQFRVSNAKPNARYELVQPEHIMRSTFEVAPVRLMRVNLLKQQGSYSYSLVGEVQNTLRRPFSGGGQLLLYDREGKLIGSGGGFIAELNPGEKSVLVMSGFLNGREDDVAAYEYMLDMRYKNEMQSVSMQDIQRLGSHTLPSRIVRVNNPSVLRPPATSGELNAAQYLAPQ